MLSTSTETKDGRTLFLSVLLIISLISLLLLSYKPSSVVKSIGDIIYPLTSNATLNSTKGVCTPPPGWHNLDPQYWCAMTSNYSERIACYRKLGLEPSPECEKKDFTERVACYNHISRIEKNPSLCDMLWDDERRECRGGCALNLLRPQECEVWGNNSYKKYLCYGKAAAENVNPGLCGKIPSSGLVYDEGGYVIPTNQLRDICLAGFALYTSNISVCDGVIDYDVRLYCKAVILNDTTHCSQMKEAFHTLKCQRDVSIVDMMRKTVPTNPLYPNRPNRFYFGFYAPMPYDNKTRLW